MQQRPKHHPGSRIRPLLSRAYDEVHMALWATLIAALIFFGAFGLPSMTADKASYSAARAHANEAEDAAYCDRWGLGSGSGKHRICVSDLEQFRHSIEKRVADDNFF